MIEFLSWGKNHVNHFTQIIRRFKAAEPGSAARAQFDLDCVDPLGRSALSIAIINENPEMMEVLLEFRIQVTHFFVFHILGCESHHVLI